MMMMMMMKMMMMMMMKSSLQHVPTLGDTDHVSHHVMSMFLGRQP